MSFYNIPERPLEPPENHARRVYTCELCGKGILEGDEYYDVPTIGPCCAECIKCAHHYEAEFEGPDPDEAYDSMREEGLFDD